MVAYLSQRKQRGQIVSCIIYFRTFILNCSYCLSFFCCFTNFQELLIIFRMKSKADQTDGVTSMAYGLMVLNILFYLPFSFLDYVYFDDSLVVSIIFFIRSSKLNPFMLANNWIANSKKQIKKPLKQQQQQSNNYMSRPQNQLPPDLYYNITEASKYESSTRIQEIQRLLTERALQLLDTNQNSFILDVGCGSGLSGETLTSSGYVWQGIDISRDMLNIASSKEQSGGLWQIDIGQGWKFRPGVFDGAISISTIQWLCVASKKSDNPFKRCCKFFQSLYESLRTGARAVLQFYPDGKHQLQMITSAAMKAGFSGGLVVDFPNSTKAKKYYLVIQAGARRNLAIVQTVGRTEQDLLAQNNDQVKVVKKRKMIKKNGKRVKVHTRKEVITNRRQRYQRQGKQMKYASKYSGRKRKPKF